MNETQIERIAAASNALRPDWPVGSLKTLLAKPMLANRAARDVAVALAWVACDSTTKTPARVLEAGPWWQVGSAETGPRAPRNPQPHEECSNHPGQFRLSCGGCNADKRAVRDEHQVSAREQREASRQASLEFIRTTLVGIREVQCQHHVDRSRCRDCRELPVETEPRDAS